VQIAVDVNDEDAVRAAAFAILNNAEGEDDFASLATRTVEAALSTLMVQSRDIEGAVHALAARIPGMRLVQLSASDGDVRPADRPTQETVGQEPQTREELVAYVRARFNGCSGWESFGVAGDGATFRCHCGEMSGAFPMEGATLESLESHVKANFDARRQYVAAWHQRHPQSGA
jgi:hypothetical protein